MQHILQDNELGHLRFAAAPINKSAIWYNEMDIALRDKEITKEVIITFVTTTGIYSVRTTLVAVIENYARIGSDVVLPLESITDLTFIELKRLSSFDHWDLYYILIFITIIGLLVLLFLLMPSFNEHLYRDGTMNRLRKHN